MKINVNEMEGIMNNLMANDVKAQYDRAFATIRGIVEAFPEGKWLEPHGDAYYIPCRIAYHLAVFTDRFLAGGYKDPDFNAKLPFGNWMEATAGTLPGKPAYLSYYDTVIEKAKKELAGLDDGILASPIAPEMIRLGSSQMGVHVYAMRELSAHTGELNKMLVEDGEDDVWR